MPDRRGKCTGFMERKLGNSLTVSYQSKYADKQYEKQYPANRDKTG